MHLNRAVHDDLVAIEMLPASQWTCPSSLVLEDKAATDDDNSSQANSDERVSPAQNNDQIN